MLLGAAALAAAPLARAQKPVAKRVLGVLNPHPKPTPEQAARTPYGAHWVKLGWRIGESLVVERPEHPDGEAALPGMADELVGRRVDAILAIGPEAAVAAARATRTIPIVFWGVGYPVEQGLVDSYARPGRNVTGVAFFTGMELMVKLLQIFREIAPRVGKVVAIGTQGTLATVRGDTVQFTASPVAAAARDLGFEYLVEQVSAGQNIEPVLERVLALAPQGLATYGTTTTYRQRQRIVDFANRHRLPHAANQVEFAEAGALFSYGANTVETVLRSIDYADKVLRGADPATLSVERPARYELAVNLKTAQVLSLEVPQAILLRADRVIE